jgi:ubiquinone/menaquinone biosynthesis C-methylase UbiE
MTNIYWSIRAKLLGPRAVFNLNHPPSLLKKVTDNQKAVLLPLLKKELTGNENLILDFGCGTGRFTDSLAKTIRGKAIGVDPTKVLLEKAKTTKTVSYKLMIGDKIPLPRNSVDIAWVFSVLGGIRDLKKTADEISRVLKSNGLLFLTESTDGKSSFFWKSRSIAAYQQSFPKIPIRPIGKLTDFGDTMTVIAGRKRRS